MSAPAIVPGVEINEGIISAQTKVAGDDGVLRNAKADNTGVQYQKASYSGAFYCNTITATNNAAFRFEAATLKLKDALIECETNDALYGDVTTQAATLAASGGKGYSGLDLSTIYFKNKVAGQNCTIIISGVRE